MNFSDLKVDPRLIEILKTKNIETPTEIQRLTFPLAANGYDVIGVSQTGSGKTLAFILPLIDQILKCDRSFHTLIIAPTRELTQQISACVMLFESLGIRHSTLVGGEQFNAQVFSINKRPHIVIGTPGRIVKHITKTKNFRTEFFRKLVLDEADRFFEQDFTEDLQLIAERLGRKNQTLMFTATLTDKTESLSKLFMKAPRVIGTAAQKYECVETLDDCFSFMPEKHKLAVLCGHLRAEGHGSRIVFVSMCASAQKLAALLQALGLSCECLHGNMSQDKREAIIRSFRDEAFGILVSTDLASRGLDIPHVDEVINYDLPSTAKDYMHRVGRTARAGKAGSAVSFVTQYDVVRLQKLEFVLKRRLAEKCLGQPAECENITELFDQITADFNGKKSGKRNK